MRAVVLTGVFSFVLVGCSGSVDGTDDPSFTPAGDETGTADTGGSVEDTAAPIDAMPDTAADTTMETTSADTRMDGVADSAKPLCEGFSTLPFDVPDKCDGPSGTTSSEIPKNGIYSTSWFGCYRKPDGTIYKDPYDNCEFACGSKGLCTSSMTGPECEANLKWFAADADRYGCGSRIRLTNCLNGKAVVVVTLDRGPNCNTIEKAYGAPVLDMSHDAMMYLFDGKEYGGGDKKRVIVERVDPATALGPVK